MLRARYAAHPSPMSFSISGEASWRVSDRMTRCETHLAGGAINQRRAVTWHWVAMWAAMRRTAGRRHSTRWRAVMIPLVCRVRRSGAVGSVRHGLGLTDEKAHGTCLCEDPATLALRIALIFTFIITRFWCFDNSRKSIELSGFLRHHEISKRLAGRWPDQPEIARVDIPQKNSQTIKLDFAQ